MMLRLLILAAAGCALLPTTGLALDMRSAPFISDRVKRKIEEDFRSSNCAGSYTVAISRSGRWGARCEDRTTLADVARMALDKCQHTAKQVCGIIVSGGLRVKFRLASVRIRYPKTFTAALVPFVRMKVRQVLKRRYGNAVGFKALALSRNGAFGIGSGAASNSSAKLEALRNCERASGRRSRCFVYAVGQSVVFSRFTNIYPDR